MKAAVSIVTILDSDVSFKTLTEPEGSRTKNYTALNRDKMCAAYVQSHWEDDGTSLTIEHKTHKLYLNAMREIDTNVENKTSTLTFEKGDENESTDKKSLKRKSTDANPVYISSESSINFDSVSMRRKFTASRPSAANLTEELDQNHNEKNPAKIVLRRKSRFDNYEVCNVSSDSNPLSTLAHQEPSTNQRTAGESSLTSNLLSEQLRTSRTSQPGTSRSFLIEKTEVEDSKTKNRKRKCDDEHLNDANRKQIKSDSGVLSCSTIYSNSSDVRKEQTKDLTKQQSSSPRHSKKSSSRRDTLKDRSSRNDRKHSSKLSSSKDKSSHLQRNSGQSSSRVDSDKPSSSAKHSSKDSSRNDEKESSKSSSPKVSDKSSHLPRYSDQSSSRRDSIKPSSSRRDSVKPSSSRRDSVKPSSSRRDSVKPSSSRRDSVKPSSSGQQCSKDSARNSLKNSPKQSSSKDVSKKESKQQVMTVLKNALARYSLSSSNESLTTEKLIEVTRNIDGAHFNNLSNSLKTLGMTPPKTTDNNASRGVISSLKDVNLFGPMTAKKHSEPSLKKCDKNQNSKNTSSEFVDKNTSTTKSKPANTEEINNNKHKPKPVAANHSTSGQGPLINSMNGKDVIDEQKTNKKIALETKVDSSKSNHKNSEPIASSSKSVNATTSTHFKTEQNGMGNQSPKVKELYDNDIAPHLNPKVMLYPMKLNLNTVNKQESRQLDTVDNDVNYILQAKNGKYKITKDKSSVSAAINKKKTSVPSTHSKIDCQSQTVDKRKPVKIEVTVETHTDDDKKAAGKVGVSTETQTDDGKEATVKVGVSAETQTDDSKEATVKVGVSAETQTDDSKEATVKVGVSAETQTDDSKEATVKVGVSAETQTDDSKEATVKVGVPAETQTDAEQPETIVQSGAVCQVTPEQPDFCEQTNILTSQNDVSCEGKSPDHTVEELQRTINELKTRIAEMMKLDKVTTGSLVTSPRAETFKNQLTNSNLPSTSVTTGTKNMSGSSSSTTLPPVIVKSVAENSVAPQSSVSTQLTSMESKTTMQMTHPVNQTYMNRNRNLIATAQTNFPISSLTTSTATVNSVNSVVVHQQLKVDQPKSSQILITTPDRQWTVPLALKPTQNSNYLPLSAPVVTTSSPQRALENVISVNSASTATTTTTSTFKLPIITPHSLLPRQPQRITSLVRRNTCTATEPSRKPSTQPTLQMNTCQKQQQSLQQSHPMQPSTTDRSWFQSHSGQQCEQQISSTQIQPATNTVSKTTTQQLHYQQSQFSQVPIRTMARSHSIFMTKQQIEEYKQKSLFKNTGSTNVSVQQPAQQSVQQPVQQSVQQPVQQSVQKPVQQCVQQPVQQCVQQPVQQSVQQPVQQSVQKHVQQSVQQISNAQNQQWSFVANTIPVTLGQSQQYQQTQCTQDATSALNGYVANQYYYQQYSQFGVQQQYPNNLQNQQWGTSNVANTAPIVSTPEQFLQSSYQQYQQHQRCQTTTGVLNTSQTQEQFQQPSGQQFQPLQSREVQSSRVENRARTIYVRSPNELLQSRYIQPCSSNAMLKSMLEAPSPQIQPHCTSANLIPTQTQQLQCQQQQFQPQLGSGLQNRSTSVYISNLEQLHNQQIIEQQRQNQQIIEQQRQNQQIIEQQRKEQHLRAQQQLKEKQIKEKQLKEKQLQKQRLKEEQRQRIQRQEEQRQEEQRQEEQRQDMQRQEEQRQEERRQEEQRQKIQREEQLRQEQQRQEEQRQEVERQERLKGQFIDELKRDIERQQNERIYKMRQEQQSARNRNLAPFEEPDFWCIHCTRPATLICATCFAFSSCNDLCWELLKKKHDKTCSSTNIIKTADLKKQ